MGEKTVRNCVTRCTFLDFCASFVGHTDGEGHKKIISCNYSIELKNVGKFVGHAAGGAVG